MRFWTSGLSGVRPVGNASLAQDLSALAGAAAERETGVAPSAKVDVNAPDVQGTPALHWAVRLDDIARLPDAAVRWRRREAGQPLRLHAAGARRVDAATRRSSGCCSTPARTPTRSIRRRDDADDCGAGRRPGCGSRAARRGAVVDARDKTYQQTALMVAVRENHPPIVQLLIERGADVNAKTRTARRRNGCCRTRCPASATASASSAAALPPRGRGSRSRVRCRRCSTRRATDASRRRSCSWRRRRRSIRPTPTRSRRSSWRS